MGKSKSTSTSNRTGRAKAGKRSTFIAPPAASDDKLAGREAGEQQFAARTQPRTTSCLCCQTFDGTRLFKTCRFDSGLRFDASRGRIVTPPRKKEAAK